MINLIPGLFWPHLQPIMCGGDFVPKYDHLCMGEILSLSTTKHVAGGFCPPCMTNYVAGGFCPHVSPIPLRGDYVHIYDHLSAGIFCPIVGPIMLRGDFVPM